MEKRTWSFFGRLNGVSPLILFMSVLILFTSLIDLFVNRLLFRGGPEVLSHMNFDPADLAIVGAISLNIEQLALFVVVGFLSFELIIQGRRLDRLSGLVLFPLLVCSALLYLPLPDSVAWAASVIIIGTAGIAVVGLSVSRSSRAISQGGKQALALVAFMLMMTLGFILPFYYRLSLLSGAVGFGGLPQSLASYEGGIVAVWGASVAAFAYAIVVTGGKHNVAKTLAIAALISTLIVGPILYGLVSSFFMTQIFSLVIAMSTDFALSLTFVQVMIVAWWFLLAATLLLFLKGRGAPSRQLTQEGIGLLLLMSTTFLFGYPYYIMLGIAGVLLITHPNSEKTQT